MMKLVKDAYHSWGAEVVFITSNWAGNKEIMEGCKEAGIPAFVRTIFHLCLPRLVRPRLDAAQGGGIIADSFYKC